MVKEKDHNYDMLYNDMEFSINFSLEVTIAQYPSHYFPFVLRWLCSDRLSCVLLFAIP